MPTESERREASRRTSRRTLRLPLAVDAALDLLAAGPGRVGELVSELVEERARSAGVWDEAVASVRK